jgi:hypothetical protein
MDASLRVGGAADDVYPTMIDGMHWLAGRFGWVMLGAVVLFYIAGLNGQWRIEPDSALYLSLARNLAAGEGYTYHGQPHELAYPGFPLLLSGLFRLFGPDTLWPAHVMILLLAMASLALIYRLFWLFGGHTLAVLITWIAGSAHTHFRYAFQLRNDLPFLVGVLACLAGFEAIFGRRADSADAPPRSGRWYDWTLLAAGLVIVVTMRPHMMVFVPVLLVSVAWAIRHALRWQYLAVGGAVIAAIGLFFLLDPRRRGDTYSEGAYEGIILDLLQTAPYRAWDNFGRMLSPILPEVMMGIELEWWWLNALAGLLILVAAALLFRIRMLWGLWVFATVAMMLVVHPDVRYFLPVLPLLVYAVWRGVVGLSSRLPRPWLNIAFAGLMMLWIGPNVGKNVGLILEQRHSPFLEQYRGGRYLPVAQLAEHLEREVEPQAWVIAPDKLGRVLTYLGDRRVVEAGDLARWPVPPGGPLYVIEPVDEDPRLDRPHPLEEMRRLGLRTGEAIASVPRVERREQLPPLTLHRAVPEAASPDDQPPNDPPVEREEGVGQVTQQRTGELR